MSAANRNVEIFNRFLAGEPRAKLAQDFGISHARLYQLINDQKQFRTFQLEKSELIDKNIAQYGTWEQKVSTLMPHIEAIRAIAEKRHD